MKKIEIPAFAEIINKDLAKVVVKINEIVDWINEQEEDDEKCRNYDGPNLDGRIGDPSGDLL